MGFVPAPAQYGACLIIRDCTHPTSWGLAGFVFDRTGSYTAFFALIMTLLLGTTIMAFKLKEEPGIVPDAMVPGSGDRIRKEAG